ncbi:hypothetical protein FRB95_007734 [Tulasnella sp. JGI-2019a]|nr:hypothetical protein FRB95_007734 [Tulasnella sp. JGI-2019a]
MVLATGLIAFALSAFFAVADAIPTVVPHLGASHRHHHRHLAANRRNATSPLERRGSPNDGYVSMAYMGNWDIYARNFFVTNLPVSRITHVLYSFANIAADGSIILSDAWADTQIKFAGDDSTAPGNNLFGNFKQLYLLKQQNRHLKVILSIGGWSYKDNFAPIITANWRAQFIKTAVQMVEDYGLDGLDVDMEYPVASNVEAFCTLLAGLRTALDALSTLTGTSKYLLSIAVPAGTSNYSPLQPYMSQINSVLDFINLMAYDYCGPTWQATACDIANVNGGTTFNTASAVTWYLANGVSTHKLVMGSPLYGYAYSDTTGHDQTYTGSPPGDWGTAGTYDYKDLPLGTSPVITEDSNLIASWAYDSATQVLASYDTPKIAKAKAQWLIQQNLAGSMYWEVSGDKSANADSLIYQFSSTFEGAGGMDSSCNHLIFPNSQFDNIKNGMGIQAMSCDGSAGPSSSSSVSSSTSTSISTSASASVTTTASLSSTTASTTPSTSVSITSNSQSIASTTGSTTVQTTTNPITTSQATRAAASQAATTSSGSNPVTPPVNQPGKPPVDQPGKPVGNPAPPPTVPPKNEGGDQSKTSGFVPCNWKPNTSKKCARTSVWQKSKTYEKNATVQCNNHLYKANWQVTSKWWANNSNEPYPSTRHGAWSLVGSC